MFGSYPYCSALFFVLQARLSPLTPTPHPASSLSNQPAPIGSKGVWGLPGQCQQGGVPSQAAALELGQPNQFLQGEGQSKAAETTSGPCLRVQHRHGRRLGAMGTGGGRKPPGHTRCPSGPCVRGQAKARCVCGLGLARTRRNGLSHVLAWCACTL